MGASAQPSQNHLLGALPPAEAQRWMPLLESVDLPLGHVLYESGGALGHVYFPTTAIVSLLYVMENGASAEIAVVVRASSATSPCSTRAGLEKRSCECYAVVKRGDERLLPNKLAH